MTQRTKAWRCAGHGPVAGVVLVVLLLPLNGCVPEARSSEAIHQYQRASEELGEAASALFVHANSVEAETYIDTQTFLRNPLSEPEVRGRAVLSNEGVRLRLAAIKSLSAYTLALAEVASGKSEDQIAAHATAAGKGIAGLTGDLEAALTKDRPEARTADYSGIITAAASAAGELVQLLEKRHSRAELRANLKKNDPAMKALFLLIGTDAGRIYQQQKQAVNNRGTTMYESYAMAIRESPPNGAYVLDLSDRIKRFRKQADLLALADPKPAFTAWAAAHDELVTVLLDSGGAQKKKQSLREIVADVEAFAGEVQPLAANVQALAQAI